jgi:hypothetical protein
MRIASPDTHIRFTGDKWDSFLWYSQVHIDLLISLFFEIALLHGILGAPT